eukprot:COSAG06_NODE_14386_length_1161_cov_1.161017_1_plen_265_part_10
MGISTDITITPGQTVTISGDSSVEWAPRWGSGGFDVQARGSLSLTYIGLDSMAPITLNNGGSLSMALMAVSVATMSAAMSELGGAGSALHFADVTVLEHHYAPLQTIAITVNDDGSRTHEGSLSFGSPVFNVSSGPCEVSQGARCVGRVHGYGKNEDCEITVSGGGGTLSACTVFDINCPACDAPGAKDAVTLPAGEEYRGSDCPAGVSLATDHTLTWHSSHNGQGNNQLPGYHGVYENGCDIKGTCGLPFSFDEIGGGWEVCFV